jgi:hypothetical protein
MYRAIALFEHSNEDYYEKVRVEMLALVSLRMMQEKDQAV